MKKKYKKYLLYSSLLIIILLILYFGGFLQTIFYGFVNIHCMDNEGIIYCSDTTSGAVGNEATASNPNETFKVPIYQQIDTYFYSFYDFKNALTNYSSDWNEFFTINKNYCSGGTPMGIIRLNLGEPARVDYWRNKLNISVEPYYSYDCGDTYEIYPQQIVTKYFPNQLIIIEGVIQNTRDNPTITKPFKTYGICDVVGDGGTSGAYCNIHAPAVNGSEFGTSHGIINSMKIILKVGGYKDDNSICVENGIEKCVEQDLYVCNSFNLVNNGKVEGKCGYSINNTIDNSTCTNCNINNQTIDNSTCISNCENTINQTDNFQECVNNCNPKPDYLMYAIIIIVVIAIGFLFYLLIKRIIK